MYSLDKCKITCSLYDRAHIALEIQGEIAFRRVLLYLGDGFCSKAIKCLEAMCLGAVESSFTGTVEDALCEVTFVKIHRNVCRILILNKFTAGAAVVLLDAEVLFYDIVYGLYANFVRSSFSDMCLRENDPESVSVLTDLEKEMGLPAGQVLEN
jgi:hypothetical protein